MSILDKILGRALASKASKQQELSIATGVPALGLDAFASTAYGPEAALTILLPLGVAGLHYFFGITIAIVILLFLLYLSYQQTTAAYPNGGGAYIVASTNLGKKVGVWAAIALLLDYLLNVAVGISAGIGAIVSAFPSLQHYTLALCLIILLMLTIINLRGVRESGLAFIIPALLFVACMSVTFLLGFGHTFANAGHPTPAASPPSFSKATEMFSVWLLLSAFANGLTAMTGIEAVSNAVPLFRKPAVKNAQWTLTIIVGILALFLVCLGYLCPSYHIVAMDESKPGYQTILSQLVGAIVGKNPFYYFTIACIFIILTYSAQTSFVGFPRVCRLLAEDNFLPHFFAERGRRLVYSHGIILLAIFSAVLLIAFNGITLKLIPLFAVGAFSAFLFSQTGMVVHWLRNKDEPNSFIKLIFNAIGAVATAIALIIIIAAKFVEGAWIIIIVAPILVSLLTRIRRHYILVAREIEKPLELKVMEMKPPIVIIPIQWWNCVAEKAVRFGLGLSDDVTAVYISAEDQEECIQKLKKIWKDKVTEPAKSAEAAIPHLEIIYSPYRRIYKPILDFVNNVKKNKPKRIIAVIIPELIEAHWYEALLHNIHVAGLRTLIFFEHDQRTIVITIPWYLHEVS